MSIYWRVSMGQTSQKTVSGSKISRGNFGTIGKLKASIVSHRQTSNHWIKDGDEELLITSQVVPLRESDYRNIGKAVHFLSQIELNLYATYMSISSTPNEQKCARAPMGGRIYMLLDVIDGSENWSPVQKKQLKDTLEYVLKIRNQVCHGVWCLENEILVCKFPKHGETHNGVDMQKAIFNVGAFDELFIALEVAIAKLDALKPSFSGK